MRKILAIILCLIVLAIALVGCSGGENYENVESKIAAQTQSRPAPINRPESTRPVASMGGIEVSYVLSLDRPAVLQFGDIEITVARATNERLRQFGGYDEFLDDDNDQTHPAHAIIITTNAPIRNFRISEMGWVDRQGGSWDFYARETLFNARRFTPENPLVIRGVGWPNIPTRAYSFVGNDGVARYFTIGRSGYDGSIIANEFQNTPPQ